MKLSPYDELSPATLKGILLESYSDDHETVSSALIILCETVARQQAQIDRLGQATIEIAQATGNLQAQINILMSGQVISGH